jgi:hypothetical protein
MQQMRKKLARCFQGERTVTEYSHELQELFIMIGTVSERDQVLRFWNGVKPEVQAGLWRAQLNSEISSWGEVLAQAEIIEISENVAHCKDPGRGQPKAVQLVGPGFPHWRTTPARESQSSRSMTIESNRRNRRHHKQSTNRHTPSSQPQKSAPLGSVRSSSSRPAPGLG